MISKDAMDPELQFLPKLGFFLASKDVFANDLKTALSSMSAHEDIFLDMINQCSDEIENDRVLEPTVKHIYLRVIILFNSRPLRLQLH